MRAAGMRLEQVAEAEEPSRSPLGSCRCVWNSLFLCVGDMSHLDKYMQGMQKVPTNPLYFL